MPLAGLPVGAAAAIWLLLQAAAVLAAMWIAMRAGGARRSLETLLWCGVAATWFMPVFDTLWKGNVTGFLALQVALALRRRRGSAASAIATATLLKLVPVVSGRGLAGGPRATARWRPWSRRWRSSGISFAARAGSLVGLRRGAAEPARRPRRRGHQPRPVRRSSRASELPDALADGVRLAALARPRS